MKTVLVVEDDDSMRLALQRLLGACGFDCIAFASAEALLQEGVCETAACVVSDLSLPGMSGIELLTALRAMGSSLPLIVITAHDAPGMHDNARRCGAAGYLAKPFLAATLLDAVTAATRPVGSP